MSNHDKPLYAGRSDWTCLQQDYDYYANKCPKKRKILGFKKPTQKKGPFGIPLLSIPIPILGDKTYQTVPYDGDKRVYSKSFSDGYCFGDVAGSYQNRHFINCYYPEPTASSMALKEKVDCCTGKNTRQDQCPRSLYPGSGACDQVMLDYCKDRPDDPLCGCAMDAKHYGSLKTIGPLQCVDKRCTNPAAYKLTSQKEPCNLTQCIVGDITLSAEDMANIDDFALSQNCGEDFLKKLEEQGKNGETAPEANGETNGSWFSWIGLNGDTTNGTDQQAPEGTGTAPTEKKETNVVMWVSIVIAILLLVLGSGYFLFARG